MTEQNTGLTLYLLTRTDEIDYQEPDAQVVIAADEGQARRLAMGDLSKDQQLSWLDPQRSACVAVAKVAAGGPGHVLTAHAPS
ncbi:hypothetical protein AB0H36_41600 [Kribbella sp. NPDC050820]|uniref:hypothetical protein n=1 Tax=Kribbella sp. NPDC050820 TaxID=3155408 RepID=UPI0033D17AA1